MLLTPQVFKDLWARNQLAITLIGMSGMGKTYRSLQLASLGFLRLSSDDYVSAHLGSLPGTGTAGVAAWMGQPYESQHAVRSAQYLALEEESIRTFLTAHRTNTIIDTTGSFIYLSPRTIEHLKQQTLIVYLEANQSIKDRLFHIYTTDPKPVVWGDRFHRLPDESDREALRRCYPELLTYRSARYAAIADVTLPYSVARDEQSTGEIFLKEIQTRLA
ncbi:MAG: AAA family ATPase [Patescibacteria group bacterium]